ncbi:MAG: toprim domain-containing protein [Candidatus Colwellbacteria bacterium]|jgi:recombination protein RecR|nr:toprim domain-containing protein [Candidatus Colwellbacteria bacterium]MCK9497529.1 toprim domain-containing protein [Candidatus Colwellbacteria bacterium]MDD3752457.1 toprim domain-containing protein [Candidatus Colwellbacteria bacterium]MDD4818673.1 toprim domain-containing protein [Candidatus Colwellbacteria bacterium]
MKIPKLIRPFVDEFSKLPGVGPRQALRLAFYLTEKGSSAVAPLADAVAQLANLKTCPYCFSVHDQDGDLCEICNDHTRDLLTVAVVEKETDLISMENTGKYRGVYLLIGDIKKAGNLNERQKMKLDSLKSRLASTDEGKAHEIIIAFSPTTAGDISAEIIAENLRGSAKKISRLGRGIPIGGEVEFADPDTLGEAIEGRK